MPNDNPTPPSPVSAPKKGIVEPRAKIYTPSEWAELMKDHLLAPVEIAQAMTCLRPMGMDEVMTKNGPKEPKRLAGENKGIFTEEQ